MAGLITPNRTCERPRALRLSAGSHDPLLEWTLARESGCGPRKPAGREPKKDCDDLTRGGGHDRGDPLARVRGTTTNVPTSWPFPTRRDSTTQLVIAFARRGARHRGRAPGNPLGLSDIDSIAKSGARMAQTSPGVAWRANAAARTTGARWYCGPTKLALVNGNRCAPPERTSRRPVRSGPRRLRGLRTRSVALAAALEFLPLTWEHFDLVLRQAARLFLARPAGSIRFHSIAGPARGAPARS